jgi:hypothetical protein
MIVSVVRKIRVEGREISSGFLRVEVLPMFRL